MATASARARHGGYLFQRPGSANWYVKLRTPGEKRKEVSLGTPDKLEAEIAAAPLVADHKAKLLAARPRLVPSWAHRLEPGREHAAPDGDGKIVATDRELIHIGHNGSILKIEPNGGPADRLINWPMGVILAGDATPPAMLAQARRQGWGPVINLDALKRPAPATKSADDAILETYIKHANVTGYPEREARATWALFKSLCDKPLKDCDRDDGRKLVAHFEGEGLKSATIQKKLMWLSAACSLAIKEGKLKFNPFSSVVPKRDDQLERVPLSDADIATAKRNLGKLDKADALLFRLLACSGMRLSEAFEIAGEETEKGCRFVTIGSKTDTSRRRVPLPTATLSFLPATIKGKLFEGGPAAASKRLNRFLGDCGITDARKVVHSLRHRAKDRLRAAGCPLDVQYELLGHETTTVASGYGRGSPVPLLARWTNRIGF